MNMTTTTTSTPREEPQELSYKIANNTYATVTPMGNWNAMRDDRNKWRKVAESLATQIGSVDIAQAEYEQMGDEF